MIIEQENNTWLVLIQNIPIGQCFYYGNTLYLRVNPIDKAHNDKVIAVDLNKNEIDVFPYNIKVIAATTKIVVDDILNTTTSKLLKFNKEE